jgi:hypothetical protein
VGIEPYGISRIKKFGLFGLPWLFGTIKSRWIYLQLAISLSSFLELELCRQCIFLGGHNNEGILIYGLVRVNISFIVC